MRSEIPKDVGPDRDERGCQGQCRGHEAISIDSDKDGDEYC